MHTTSLLVVLIAKIVESWQYIPARLPRGRPSIHRARLITALSGRLRPKLFYAVARIPRKGGGRMGFALVCITIVAVVAILAVLAASKNAKK